MTQSNKAKIKNVRSNSRLRIQSNFDRSSINQRRRNKALLFGFNFKPIDRSLAYEYEPLSPFFDSINSPIQSIACSQSLRFPINSFGHIQASLSAVSSNSSLIKLVPSIELGFTRGNTEFGFTQSFDTQKQECSLGIQSTYSISTHNRVACAVRSPPRFAEQLDWADWFKLASLTFHSGSSQRGPQTSLTIGVGSIESTLSHDLTEDGRWSNETSLSVDTDSTHLSSRISRSIGVRERLQLFLQAELVLAHDRSIPSPSSLQPLIQIGLNYEVSTSHALMMTIALNESGLSLAISYRCPAMQVFLPVHLSSKRSNSLFLLSAVIPLGLLTTARAGFLMLNRRRKNRSRFAACNDRGRKRNGGT